MDIELIKPSVPTRTIDSFGFHCVDGERRGTLRVQFKNEHDVLTALGDYLEVPRTLWQGLRTSKHAGTFVAQQVKPFFEWRIHVAAEPMREPPDETLPDMIVIPASTPNSIEATDQVIDSQRTGAMLFT